MRNYCKAYYLKDLRKFSGWKEIERPDAAELTDDAIVYLQDNFTVVKDCFEEEDYIYEVFERFWSSYRSILRDMSDQDDRLVHLLGYVHAHLCHDTDL